MSSEKPARPSKYACSQYTNHQYQTEHKDVDKIFESIRDNHLREIPSLWETQPNDSTDGLDTEPFRAIGGVAYQPSFQESEMRDLRRFRPGRSPFDDIMHLEDDGTEWWSAREMMEPMGYARWENTENVIRRAKIACRKSGHQSSDHFRDATKVVTHPSGRQQVASDVQMSRYGCYMFALSGDSTKPEIALAKNYFAIMTRAAEKAVDVPVAIVQSPRPWSVRFRETTEDHLRFMYMNHPGKFTVVTTSIGQMLLMEDELIRHLFEIKPSDRPDVSIGRCWSEHRKAHGLSPVEDAAPLYLPDQDREVWLHVYPDNERGTFEAWFGLTYLPSKLANYYDQKPEFKVHGPLPPASAADHTCQRLTGKPAALPPKTRRQLVAVGGFFPVGKQLPKPEKTQGDLF